MFLFFRLHHSVVLNEVRLHTVEKKLYPKCSHIHKDVDPT
jgi:hypothetical protein